MTKSITILTILVAVIAGLKNLSAQNMVSLVEDFQNPTDIGPGVLVSQTQGAAIGDKSLYFVTNGAPAIFYETDKRTGEILFSKKLPGSDVVWGMTQGENDKIYFSGTNDGWFYQYDPVEKHLEKLGKNPSANWVWDLTTAPDGTIYGVTYPNAGLFKVNPSTAEMTFVKQMHEEQNYARSLEVTHQYVYTGIGIQASLVRMDLHTGETKEIPLPISGDNTSISGIWETDERLFVAYGTSLLVLDMMNFEVKNHIVGDGDVQFGGMLLKPHPDSPNEAFFIDRKTGQLWKYHLREDRYTPVVNIVIPTSPAKALRWNSKGEIEVFHYEIMYSTISLKKQKVVTLEPKIPLQPIPIQSLEIFEDHIYLGGYQGGFSKFDLANSKFDFQEKNPHQIEGMGYFREEVILGTYGGARIYRYDPEDKYAFSNSKGNPSLWYDIGEEQSRPFTIDAGSRYLVIGTIPDYGELGGALTIYDSKKEQWNTYRNIIPNQSITGVILTEDKVYGGSSTAGGLGIEAIEENARLLKMDLESGNVQVFIPSLTQLDQIEMIGELSIGPDQNIWGIAYGISAGEPLSVVFVLDPQTFEIKREIAIFPGLHRGSQWRPFYLRWSPDGYLYLTAARRLSRIDPELFELELILETPVNLMDIDTQGNIFFTQGPNLFKMTKKTLTR